MGYKVKSYLLPVFITAVVLGTSIFAQTNDLFQQIQIVDKDGKPIPGIEIQATAGNQTWGGVSDDQGRFFFRVKPRQKCYVYIDSPGYKPLEAELTIPATGPVTKILTPIKKPGSLQKGGCPPDRMMSDGSCGTPDKARAQFEAGCQSYSRGSIAVRSSNGGYECGCPPGQASVTDNGNRSCVSLQSIARNAVADCKRQSPDLVPSTVGIDGSYECRCPEGRSWQPANRNNPGGGCVSNQAIANDNSLCESTMAGSTMGEDAQGRRGCVCPAGYTASSALRKCLSDQDNTYDGLCDRLMAGSIDGLDSQGRRGCVCPSGYTASNVEKKCVLIRSTPAVNNDAELCEKTLAGSIMGEDDRGRRGCVCPSGYTASVTAKKCVQIKPSRTEPPTQTEPESVFVGTWKGIDVNKGVTIIINKDFTGVFRETRPGWPTYPDGGKMTWRVYPGKPNWIILSVGTENMLVDGVFVKAGTILKFLDGVLIDRWSQAYTK